jgi:hypothetical protein
MSLDWFIFNIGKPLLAVRPDGSEVEVVVRNEHNATWFLAAQSLGWQFKEKVRIHRSLDACVACEG